MKAIVHHRYGSPDVLECAEIEKPAPADGEVLIAVRAAAINPADRFLLGGRAMIRPFSGLRGPKNPRVGSDLAGTVEAVGRNVTQFRPGDEVFGVSRGAIAEYVGAAENKLARKPANVTFEQAAAVPVAGCTALQGLRDAGRLRAGQTVLIIGAGGGVGTFAVQMARAFGAEVTAVCSTKSVEMVRSIGADHVIDYTREDFTRGGKRWDVILDSVASHSLRECRRVTSSGGIYITNGGEAGGRLGPLPRMLGARMLSAFVSQKLTWFLARVNQPDLIALRHLMETGKVTPVVDRQYPLSEAADAFRYLAEGHASGKIVITI